MTLQSLTVNLLVADVNASARFYTDVLGFELSLGVIEGTQDVVFEAAGARLAFAMLRRDAVEIMLQSHASAGDDLPGFRACEDGDAVSLYVDVDDVDALWEQLHDRVNVVKELGETFYGAREFHFRDPDGFLIGFAQRLEEH